MSSTAKVTTQIKDLEVLKKSLRDLNLKFSTNSKNVHFYGSGAQDLDVYISSHRFGFAKQADGLFQLVADSDYRGTYNQVLQKYSENLIRKEIQKRNFKVASTKVLEDGTIRMVVKQRAFG